MPGWKTGTRVVLRADRTNFLVLSKIFVRTKALSLSEAHFLGCETNEDYASRAPRLPAAEGAKIDTRHNDTLEVPKMKRVRLSVDVDPELRRRVKVAAASKDQSVKEWIEDVIRRELERELDRSWMESDLSRLGEFEPYEWEEGELEEGKPVRYEPGVGFIVEGGRDPRG